MRSETEPRLALLLALGLSLFVCPPTATRGCGNDDSLGDGFGASHARSLTVAFAVSDAIDAGVMDKSALNDQVGDERAVLRLAGFHRRLLATTAKVGSPPSISVLLVDSGLWSRLSADARGSVLATHTAGPQPGDVVIVTHEAVLAALDSGKLSMVTALDHALLVIDGEATAVKSVRSLLSESFGKKQSQRKVWPARNERRILK